MPSPALIYIEASGHQFSSFKCLEIVRVETFSIYFYLTSTGRDKTTQDSRKSGTFFWSASPPALRALQQHCRQSWFTDEQKWFCLLVSRASCHLQMSVQHHYFKWYFLQQNHKCVISIISSLHRHYRNKQITRYSACLLTALPRKHCQMAAGQYFDMLWHSDHH